MLNLNMFRRNKESQKGAIGGIPEQVIAIAVGVIVVSGMVALGSRAFTSARTNTELANIQQLINGTRSLYSGQPLNDTTSANMATVLINTKTVPATMYTGTTLKNGFGGTVLVWAYSGLLGIKSPNYSKEACVDVLTKLPSGGMTGLAVGQLDTAAPTSNGVGNGFASGDALTITDFSGQPAGVDDNFPITPSEAQILCTRDNGNTIYITVTQ